MLDIVGIGVLNVDFTATTEKLMELHYCKVEEAMKSFEYGAERLVGKEDIEHMVSLLGRESLKASLGGSAFNTVCCLASLGSGLRAGFSGVSGETGRPDLSFEEAFDSLGVDRSHLGSCGGESSGLCVSMNQPGTRSFIHYPGCNRRMAGFLRRNYGRILEYVAGARLLHITQFSGSETSGMLERLAGDAKKADASILISCDPGYAWLKGREPSVDGILRLSDFIFLNDMEFTLLAWTGEGASDREKADSIFSRLGLSGNLIIVKKETEIKLFRSGGKEESFAIDVMKNEEISDATGAGDAFDAGFLASLLLGEAGDRRAAALGMMLMRARLASDPENLWERYAEAFSRWRKLAY